MQKLLRECSKSSSWDIRIITDPEANLNEANDTSRLGSATTEVLYLSGIIGALAGTIQDAQNSI
jgi:hypothetical protein